MKESIVVVVVIIIFFFVVVIIIIIVHIGIPAKPRGDLHVNDLVANLQHRPGVLVHFGSQGAV